MTVNLSNINTQKQQIINSLQLQENALKFYIGMPIDAKIDIPQSEFEVTPAAFSEAPNVVNRSEFLLLKKQEELLVLQKNQYKLDFTQRFHSLLDTIILGKALKFLCLQNHLKVFTGLISLH